ncbi:hypothetical protein KDW_38060 [Dictyobacter vulcani]|uniref:Activator of Hsp90 ATPase homologue 1/2-like C-terminal domain-containing protein n=1 Tax=Dictyobacter vulcani TaxID=2607529 RepID=A0A5J4KJH5_9CHLR|nr:SRPBCC family protein [Dictyobacter vulcani]GER89644.1 hypothetical protein KDW_38060 [Dictyobacter vulcani]
MHTSISKITMNATATRVWEAITKPELVKQWQYGTNLITDWQKGSSIVYRNEWEGTVYEQKGTILEIEPEKLVKFTLFAPRPGLENTPANFFTMIYAIEEANGQTTLTITQEDPREQSSQEQAEEKNDNGILAGLKKLVEA